MAACFGGTPQGHPRTCSPPTCSLPQTRLPRALHHLSSVQGVLIQCQIKCVQSCVSMKHEAAPSSVHPLRAFLARIPCCTVSSGAATVQLTHQHPRGSTHGMLCARRSCTQSRNPPAVHRCQEQCPRDKWPLTAWSPPPTAWHHHRVCHHHLFASARFPLTKRPFLTQVAQTKHAWKHMK